MRPFCQGPAEGRIWQFWLYNVLKSRKNMMKYYQKINLQEPQRNRKFCQFNKDQYWMSVLWYNGLLFKWKQTYISGTLKTSLAGSDLNNEEHNLSVTKYILFMNESKQIQNINTATVS